MYNRRFISLISVMTIALGFSLLRAKESTKNPNRIGTVNLVVGTVTVKHNQQDKTIALKKGGDVYSGDLVQTQKRSKIEIVLVDKSVIRLGPRSKIKLEKAAFLSENKKQFSAKMLSGKVYAVASKLVGDDSSFEIGTSNAVAGVRGTTFRIDSKLDKSTVVRVYTGAVAVSNAPLYQKPGLVPEKSGKQIQPPVKRGVKPGGADRVEVAGPHEVSKKEWEEFVAQAMQEVKVAADGQMSKPLAFDAEADMADEWVAWNKSRDQELAQ